MVAGSNPVALFWLVVALFWLVVALFWLVVALFCCDCPPSDSVGGLAFSSPKLSLFSTTIGACSRVVVGQSS